jgi:hypothetical protein
LLSHGITKPSIDDAVTLICIIGMHGSFGKSGLQRESMVPGLEIRAEVCICDFPSSLTSPGICHSLLNQPNQSSSGVFFTQMPSTRVLPGSKSLGVSSAGTQVSLISALMDSIQSNWSSFRHGPTHEKVPFVGSEGVHARTGVAAIATKSNEISNVNRIIAPVRGMM